MLQVIHEGFVVLPLCPHNTKPAKVIAVCHSIRELAFKRAELLDQPYIIAYPSYHLTDLYTVEADLISLSTYAYIKIANSTRNDIIECWLRYGSPTKTADRHYQRRGWAQWAESAGVYSYCKRIKPEHVVSCCHALRDILNDAIAVSKHKPTIEQLEREQGYEE